MRPDGPRSEAEIRILLVDDQPLFRRALATLIAAQPQLSIDSAPGKGTRIIARIPVPPYSSASMLEVTGAGT